MITNISAGTPDWDVPLNLALGDLQSQLTAVTAQAAATDGISRSVDSRGAVGDGVTDDKAAIQAVLNSAPPGSRVTLGARTYLINSQLVVPPLVGLAGPHGNRTDSVQLSAVIKTSAGFADSAAIRFLDQEEGGYAVPNEGIRIENLTLDGSASSGSVDGIRATGRVHGVVLDRVAIQKFPRRGISCETYTRLDSSVTHPYSWNLWNCMAFQTAAQGFYLGNQQTDSTLVNCEALGCGGEGFYFVACQNTQVTSCRAEFCLTGFHLTGSWGTGQGSGGLVMTGCSTDRSTQHGVLIDSTGAATHLINGLAARRDGRNAGVGGGAYAGLAVVSATTPVVVNGITCYPGVDDDGTGTNSPQYGVTVSGSTAVTVQGGYLHAATAGWNDSGANAVLRRSMNVLTASGTGASPTRDVSTPWNTNGAGTIALTTADQAALTVTNTGTNANLSLIDVTGSAVGTRVLDSQVSGDSSRRFDLQAGGTMSWGSGAAARDTTLGRGAASRLDVTTADLRIGTAGRGLQVAEGSNAKAGTIALVAGAATVSTTAVTASSRIQLTGQADGGTPGWLRVSGRTAGTGFTVTSSSATDTSTVAYLIIEP